MSGNDNSDNSNRSISVGGNVSGVVNSGNNNTITQTITTSNNDLKELLELFQQEANTVVEALPEDRREEFKDDVQTFMEKVDEEKQDKYFGLSKQGLLDAAEAVGQVGIKLAGYIPKIVDALKGDN